MSADQGIMRAVLKVHGVTDRLIWVADSFAGLPAPDANRYPRDHGDQLHTFPQLAVPLDRVLVTFRRYGLLDSSFPRRLVPRHASTAPIERLAVMRLDGDMYESTIQALESLYDRLAVGGFVIVDDYGNAAGCRRAVHDLPDQLAASPIRSSRLIGAGVYWRALHWMAARRRVAGLTPFSVPQALLGWRISVRACPEQGRASGGLGRRHRPGRPRSRRGSCGGGRRADRPPVTVRAGVPIPRRRGRF